MSEELWTNDAVTTLSGGISNSATTATLAAGTGALFPNPGVGQFFRATMFGAGSTTGTPNEVVYVTARSGDTVTIVRGQEGTTPTAWNAGDSFVNQFTAGAATEMAQQPDVQLQAGNWALDTGTANAVAVTLSPAPTALVAGLTLRIKKISSQNTGAVTLNVNALGAVGVTFQGAALAAGDLPASQVFTVVYNGTAFELQSNPGVNEPNGAAGGDLTGSYPNPTIGGNKVTNAKLAQMGANTIKGNNTGGTANAADLSVAQVLTMLGLITPQWGLFQNVQGSGSGSGESLSSGSYTRRALNTSSFNNITGASLSGNVISAPAGTYLCFGQAESQATASITNYTHILRVHDDNSNTTVANGLVNGYAGGANVCVVMATLLGGFVLGATGALHIDSWVSAGCDGGPSINSGESNVFASLLLVRIL